MDSSHSLFRRLSSSLHHNPPNVTSRNCWSFLDKESVLCYPIPIVKSQILSLFMKKNNTFRAFLGFLVAISMIIPTTPASADVGCFPNSDQVALFTSYSYSDSCVLRNIGEYATPWDIGLPNDSISSVRVGSNVRVVLYEHNGYLGRSEVFGADISNIRGSYVGDDMVSSLRVESRAGSAACTPGAEQVALFTGPQYSGSCVVRNTGTYSTPGAIGLPNDSISSVRVGGNARAILYQHNDFLGRWEEFTSDVSSLRGTGIGEDVVSSMRIERRGAVTTPVTVVTASPTVIRVNVPSLPNDNFANAQIISGFFGSVFGNNSIATREAGEPNPYGTSGSRSIWYRWQAPDTGRYALTTAGSNFNATISVYNGVAVNTLTLVASNGAEQQAPPAPVIFHATKGSLYSIAIDGFGNGNGALRFHWNVYPGNTLLTRR